MINEPRELFMKEKLSNALGILFASNIVIFGVLIAILISPNKPPLNITLGLTIFFILSNFTLFFVNLFRTHNEVNEEKYVLASALLTIFSMIGILSLIIFFGLILTTAPTISYHIPAFYALIMVIIVLLLLWYLRNTEHMLSFYAVLGIGVLLLCYVAIGLINAYTIYKISLPCVSFTIF